MSTEIEQLNFPGIKRCYVINSITDDEVYIGIARYKNGNFYARLLFETKDSSTINIIGPYKTYREAGQEALKVSEKWFLNRTKLIMKYANSSAMEASSKILEDDKNFIG